MTALALTPSTGRPLRALFVGCHSDDVEIGCGGTVLELVAARPDTEVCWVVLSAPGERAAEARASAEAFLAGLDAPPRVVLAEFRDGFMRIDGAEVKAFFERELKPVEPDVVFTHQRGDLHQDHRYACELTWNTFRRQLVLEYEVPKWDGDVGQPNTYLPVSEERLERKIELLMEHFGTQRSKDWFTPDLFRALPRIRGMECRSASGFAEAFYGRKLTVDLTA